MFRANVQDALVTMQMSGHTGRAREEAEENGNDATGVRRFGESVMVWSIPS